MNPMIPFAMLASFVAGWVAAYWYLSPALVDPDIHNAQYEAGLVAGRRQAANYIEDVAENFQAIDCRKIAEELRAM